MDKSKVTLLEEDGVDQIDIDPNKMEQLPHGVQRQPEPVEIEVVNKKPGVLSRIGKVLLGSIDFESLGTRVWDQIIMPNILQTLDTSLTTAIHEIIWQGHPANGISGPVTQGRDYGSYYRGPNGGPQRNDNRPAGRSIGKFTGYGKDTNVGFRTQEEAHAVRAYILNQCEVYGQLSVLEYFDEIGLPTDGPDAVHGWKKLAKSSVRITYDSTSEVAPWIVKLPIPVKLSNIVE